MIYSKMTTTIFKKLELFYNYLQFIGENCFYVAKIRIMVYNQ